MRKPPTYPGLLLAYRSRWRRASPYQTRGKSVKHAQIDSVHVGGSWDRRGRAASPPTPSGLPLRKDAWLVAGPLRVVLVRVVLVRVGLVRLVLVGVTGLAIRVVIALLVTAVVGAIGLAAVLGLIRIFVRVGTRARLALGLRNADGRGATVDGAVCHGHPRSCPDSAFKGQK